MPSPLPPLVAEELSSRLLLLYPEAASVELKPRGKRLEVRVYDANQGVIAICPAGPTRSIALVRALRAVDAIIADETR